MEDPEGIDPSSPPFGTNTTKPFNGLRVLSQAHRLDCRWQKSAAIYQQFGNCNMGPAIYIAIPDLHPRQKMRVEPIWISAMAVGQAQ
ncbi:hypothetical protein [Stenotrophomonas sp. PFBMAA-4]|uniref:hypothetical protein n=1 Tax=Stenotrophomonas sp. PFBMAA-4 TaxID=3043301 RepID=UPI0024B52D04|nr:hypothetical protein [Stenotrophomonas sp. PFBMAA-4]MDI9271832.1 hypothetical protein [Stenotrophomonas sp. PFBMAA-4]